MNTSEIICKKLREFEKEHHATISHAVESGSRGGDLPHLTVTTM